MVDSQFGKTYLRHRYFRGKLEIYYAKSKNRSNMCKLSTSEEEFAIFGNRAIQKFMNIEGGPSRMQYFCSKDTDIYEYDKLSAPVVEDIVVADIASPAAPLNNSNHSYFCIDCLSTIAAMGLNVTLETPNNADTDIHEHEVISAPLNNLNHSYLCIDCLSAS